MGLSTTSPGGAPLLETRLEILPGVELDSGEGFEESVRADGGWVVALVGEPAGIRTT